jgi:two-component system KDP operon response regulator KdpE
MTDTNISRLPGHNVLVAAQVPLVRTILTSRLSGPGCAVRTAASPAGVLASARAHPPDLVVMDAGQAGDGIRYRLLRSHFMTTGVPVLLMAPSHDGSAALEQPDDPFFLAKPARLDAIAERVATLLALGPTVPVSPAAVAPVRLLASAA